MGPIDALWHLLNLFGPAFGLALLAPTMAKALWRADLRGVPWWGLARWTFAAAGLLTVAGLVWFGRDGKMATYGAMVVGSALVLWWRGFVRRR